MIKNPIFKKVILLSGVALFLNATPVWAGFEFKGPVLPASTPFASATMSEENFLPPVGAPVMPAQSVVPVTQEPVMNDVVASSATDIYIEDIRATAEGEIVSGFGSDLPLVIALQQVVPAGYQFSFGTHVVPGAHVSWEGGAPWQVVLQNMLTPEGLHFTVQNNVVIIRQGGAEISPSMVQTTASSPIMQTRLVTPPETYISKAYTSEPPISVRRTKPSAILAKSDPTTDNVSAQNMAHMTSAVVAESQNDTEVVNIRRQKHMSLSVENKNTVQERMAGPAVTAYKNFPTEKGGLVLEDRSRSSSPVTQNQISHPVWQDTAGTSTQNNMSPSETATAPISLHGGAPVSLQGGTPIPLHGDTPVAETDNMSVAYVPPAVTNNPHPGTASDPILMTPTWHGAKNQTLRNVLKKWSDVAGVELYWSIDYDYRLNKDLSFEGAYDEAVGQILDQFAKVRPQPYGELHQGDGNMRVLVVKSYDLTN